MKVSLVPERRGPSCPRARALTYDQDDAVVVDVGAGRAGDDERRRAPRRSRSRRCSRAAPRRRASSPPRASARPARAIAPALSSDPSMPSVSQASACMPGAPSRSIASESRNSAQRPPRPFAADGHRAFAAGDERDRRRHGCAVAAHLARERAVDLGDFARFAGDRIAEDRRRVCRALRKSARPPRASCCARRDHAVLDALESRVARLGRLRRSRRARRARDAATTAARRAAPRSAAECRARPGTSSDRARTDPEAMCVGSSPVTSETMSATTGARLAAASRPPWIADRCLRTVFMSWIGAPERSSSRVVALAGPPCARPSAGSESRLEPPPDSSTSSRSSRVSAFDAPQDFLRGFLAGFVGDRMARFDHGDAVGEQPVLVARDDEPVERRFGGPALLDRERHRGGRLARADDERAAFRRLRADARGTSFSGSAAASAAWKLPAGARAAPRVTVEQHALAGSGPVWLVAVRARSPRAGLPRRRVRRRRRLRARGR